MFETSAKAIVFGATGAIGTSLVEYLSKEHPEWEIIAVSRRAGKNSNSRLALMDLPHVTIVQGDPFSQESVLNLTKPCDLIFSCVGFHRYEAKYWATQWPLFVDNLLAAVKVDPANKKLIFCDNLYAYGPGKKIGPNTSCVEPTLRTKPGVRAHLHKIFEIHMKEHPGTLTVVGAADFFGPHITDTSFLGDTMAGKIVVDGPAQSGLAIGSASVIHDFCYAPDLSKALCIASVNKAAYDRFWICPHAVHGKTIQDIANDLAASAGKSVPVSVTVMGWWLIYLLSPFMGFMWEMIEMLPFWSEDYTIDDSDFIKTFGMEATPYDEAIKSLVDFYSNKK